MCGRFAGLTYSEVREVVSAVEAGLAPRVTPDTLGSEPEARPGSFAWLAAPALEGASRGALEPCRAQWGFSVEWSKAPVFNTRIETAMGPNPGMWRKAIEAGRCLVPVWRFYEPHVTETFASPKTGRQVKRQYAFDAPEQDVLLLAAVLQDGWFSIVTTAPNDWVAPVHDRMPLVVRPSEAGVWLGPDFASLADRSSLPLRAQPEFAAANSQLSLF